MSPTDTPERAHALRRLVRRLRPGPRRGYALLGLVTLICLLSIVTLGQAVMRDLNLLRQASSDNVQWTLSQAEVEFLYFEKALDHALVAPGDDRSPVVTKFDVFYSRINTLAHGALYADLREIPDFMAPLRQIQDFLDQAVPVIDAIDSAPIARLQQLEEASEKIAPVVRQLSNAGLFHFAAQSDLRRNGIAVTLQRLALATAAMIGALGLMALHSFRLGRAAQNSAQALEQAWLRLNTVVQTSLDAVIVTDRHGRVLEFNPAAERIFGYRFIDIEGRKLGDLIVPPDQRQAHEDGLRRMNESGETRVIGAGRVQMTAMRANGETFPVEMALESAGPEDNRIVIGFLRDITARLAAERELVEARDRALAGEKAKAEFLAMMTHEIRTPLNGVIGSLSLLQETALTDRQRRYVNNMALSAQQLMHHVNTVLDIARFESGIVEAAERPTHLGRLVQDIVDAQEGHAARNGNSLQWSWESEPRDWVMADAVRLQQILLNLVGNAIKFTRNGRVAIELEALPDCDQPGKTCIEFRVIDTGIGIPESAQARIFEDFQSVEPSLQRQTGGTGLGLGIVRRLVTAMGGEYGVESEPGQGSVFWVRLPLAPAEPSEDARPARASAGRSRPLDVLLVEDNEINRELAREMLELEGHRVTTAPDGLAGVSAANDHRYDLILMDISMPVMDGLEACRRIRMGEGRSRNSPIVALSANVLPQMRDRILQAGMSGFLGKPMRVEDLRALLARIDAPADQPADDTAPSRQDPADPAPEGPAAKDRAPRDRTDDGHAPGQPPDPVIARLRDRFRQETDALFDWLATSPQDVAEIAARCHKIAGSAAAFGHLALRDALVAIETRAAQGAGPADLAPLVDAARAAWLSPAAAPRP
ncbi:PAS domain S-box-containing protein [Albidovulum inexpectatum]|uniref:histidine kinase n=1 Tax=Albidovulum inexpectatum TaxID=196587 RepID=A0A2S5JGR6_9RHOB|nr:ATP-binding protein [Albidovulum inexpectatum]PPB80706.1 PAS domain S-box-containing protein [Albidovulum inexpectatum]